VAPRLQGSDSAGQLLSMDESVKKSGVMPLERETVNSEIICE
jgi:hypothetical protein